MSFASAPPGIRPDIISALGIVYGHFSSGPGQGLYSGFGYILTGGCTFGISCSSSLFLKAPLCALSARSADAEWCIVGSAAGSSVCGCLPFHVPLHNRDSCDMMIWAGFPCGHPCVVHWGGLSSWSVCLFDWGDLLWAGVSGVCIFGDFLS